MKTITIDLYTFSELPEKVQKQVIEKYRQGRDWDDWDNDTVKDNIQHLLENKYGLVPEEISFSLNHAQGDGAAFFGKLSNLELLKARNPELGKKMEGRNLDIKLTQLSHRYTHAYTIGVKVWDNDNDCEVDDLDDDLLDLVRKASGEASQVGYETIDSMLSDETLRGELELGETFYLLNGKRWE